MALSASGWKYTSSSGATNPLGRVRASGSWSLPDVLIHIWRRLKWRAPVWSRASVRQLIEPMCYVFLIEHQSSVRQGIHGAWLEVFPRVHPSLLNTAME